MSKIRIYDDVTEFVKPELWRFLKDLDHLVPDWCSHVWVSWRANDSGDDSTIADITAYYDYRWARMTVYASWLDQSEEFKREALVHELMHLFVAPLSDYTRGMVKLLIPEDEAPRFYQATRALVAERCESVTQDLTRLVLNGESSRGQQTPEKEPYAEAEAKSD